TCALSICLLSDLIKRVYLHWTKCGFVRGDVMLELFNPAVLDVNLVYVALLAGLWLAVTAAYIPGTGLAEGIAALLLIGTFSVLTAMPTNWVAVVILVIGVATFLILPFFGERYGRFAEVGLIGQAIGGYLLFETEPVSIVLIGITLVLAVLYNRFVLIPIMRTQRSHNEYDESNEVLGLRGRVVKALDPVGTVYVNKELWRARSDEVLMPDSSVVVVAQDGLELIVEKAKNEDAPVYPPHHRNGSSA
ncbi:MAG: hypothetical protein KC496_18100, partial [Anaerolineae bacterium]|nr:hypothetical protein [Anaerolineae bacterium]